MEGNRASQDKFLNSKIWKNCLGNVSASDQDFPAQQLTLSPPPSLVRGESHSTPPSCEGGEKDSGDLPEFTKNSGKFVKILEENTWAPGSLEPTSHYCGLDLLTRRSPSSFVRNCSSTCIYISLIYFKIKLEEANLSTWSIMFLWSCHGGSARSQGTGGIVSRAFVIWTCHPKEHTT